MSAEDRRRFPRLYQFLRYSLPALASIRRTVNDVRPCDYLSCDELERVLKWGELPQVKVVESTAEPTSPSRKTQMELELSRVRDFECPPRKRSARSKETGQSSRQAGVTFLEQLCDWAHSMKGVETSD